jgi:outer membrane protein assembly factor BamB
VPAARPDRGQNVARRQFDPTSGKIWRRIDPGRSEVDPAEIFDPAGWRLAVYRQLNYHKVKLRPHYRRWRLRRPPARRTAPTSQGLFAVTCHIMPCSIRTRVVFVLALFTLAISAVDGWAQAVAPIAEGTARRVGLTRAWFAQVAVSSSTDRVDYLTLNGDLVLVQSSGGVVHALDAETGRTVWAKPIGVPGRVSLAPGANAHFVAAVNGSTLYLMNRATGDVLWTRKLKGSPGAGPVFTDTSVFVPLVDGMVEGYTLEKTDLHLPWSYKSHGRIFHQPVVAARAVGWTTDKGYLYVAKADPMVIHGRLKTRAAIESRAAYWTPYFFTCSLDGTVYASHAKSLEVDWTFTTGEPIHEPPIAVNEQVFVIPQYAGMYCLNAADGKEIWLAPEISQFVSRSASRIYALDKMKNLAILDAKSGARLGTMPLDVHLTKMRNEQNDRMYFFSSTGMVECLHEVMAAKATPYAPSALDWAEGALAKAKEKEKEKKGVKAGEAGDEMPAGDKPDEEMKEEMPDDAKKKADNPFAN